MCVWTCLAHSRLPRTTSKLRSDAWSSLYRKSDGPEIDDISDDGVVERKVIPNCFRMLDGAGDAKHGFLKLFTCKISWTMLCFYHCLGTRVLSVLWLNLLFAYYCLSFNNIVLTRHNEAQGTHDHERRVFCVLQVFIDVKCLSLDSRSAADSSLQLLTRKVGLIVVLSLLK